MRKLTYYVACSIDGFIAQTDGSHDGFSQDLDYLSELFRLFPETVPSHLRETMGIRAENRQFDVVLMGRKTYEIGLQAGITSPYDHLEQYLFSRHMAASPSPDVKLVSEHAVEVVTDLKQQNGKGIWLCGGGTLATTLFRHQLVDRLILKINPFLMGAGIPLFAHVIQQTPLTLTDQTIYKNGVAVLSYEIQHKIDVYQQENLL